MFGQSTHSVINHVNLYNFVISAFDDLTEEQRKAFIVKLKFNVGLTFCDGLKNYVFRKDPKHPIIDFL